MSKKLAAAVSMVGFLASAGMAFAQTTAVVPTTTATPSVTTSATQPAQAMMLDVGAAGKILLRGTIVSVSTGSLTVKGWGGNWTVTVSSSAQVLPQGTALSSFHTGDFVGVQGTIDSTSNWTVNATLVRDWTARQAMTEQIKANVQAVHATLASGPRTVQGTLSNLNASSQSFTLTNTAGTAFAVSLTSGAEVLGSRYTTIDFSKVNNGDTVRVYGTIASSTISASIFRDVTVK